MVSRSYEANESSRAAKRQRRDLGRDSRSAELYSSNPGNRRIAQPRQSVARATEVALESCGLHARAFAVAILHDDGQVTFETSKNIDRFKHQLFPKGGWEQLQQASKRNALPPPVDDHASHDDEETISPAFSIGTPFFDESEVSHPSSPARNRYYLPPKASRPRKGKNLSPMDSPLDSPLDSPPDRLLRSGSSGCRKTTIDESQDEDTRTTQGQDQPRAVSFCISNEKAVEEAYEIRLRQIQQMGLKKILKAWIKVAEPKKQTNYPYISSRAGQNREPKVPPWWPIDRVIHKEPDHINKEARIILAIVMLRMRERGPGWIAKLEESTKNVDLRNEERSKAVERVVRRRKLLQSLYDMAKMEEEYYLEDIDGSTMCTIYDIPPIKDVPKKRLSSKAGGNKESNKKAKPVPSPPSSMQSIHQLVSPTARLGLENIAQPVPRYHPRLGEPLNTSVPLSEAPRYSRDDGMLSGNTLPITIQNNIQHRYSSQQPDVVPQRFADSQMQIDESYGYDVKTNRGIYDDPPPTYMPLRDSSHKSRASSVVYNSWHHPPAAEPFSPAPTSYAPTPTQPYQPAISNFPGRMDYSFQTAGHTGPLIYQTPTPVTSPISLAPSSTSQSFSQPSAHDLQERGPQSSLDTSQYPGSTFRTTSLSNPHGLPFLMPGHQQF